ncbi:MAG: CopG family ribbon-helix-helix protein [Roseiarcus sp.]
MSLAFTIDLDSATIDALDEVAELTERARGGRVAQAIEDFLARSAWQFANIGSGLAAADRGEFASEEEVERVRARLAAEE